MNLDNITVNAQSSIRIEGSKVLYFDVFEFEEDKHDADIIFITHDHFDHFDINSINKVKNNNTIIIAPLSTKDIVLKEFEETENTCLFLNTNDEITLDNIYVSAIPSYNISKPFHPLEKGYIGYVVNMDGTTYFIAGDTDENEDNLKVKCDVALVPIGGKFTMDPSQAASYINKIKPSFVVPTHYGKEVGNSEDGETFEKLVDSDIEVVIKI